MSELLLADYIEMVGTKEICDKIFSDLSINITEGNILAWSRNRRSLAVKPVLVRFYNNKISDIFIGKKSLLAKKLN